MTSGWTNLEPPTVNCWFCNEDFCIDFDKDDSGWTCPGCQQYNGFNEDGDYDRTIPEQYKTVKDDKAYCRRENIVTKESVLCRLCQQNQALKVGQLASFVPLSEWNYNHEVEAYDEYLESVYRLCHGCQEKVRFYLTKQDNDILKELDRESLQIASDEWHDNRPDYSLLARTNDFYKSWMRWAFFCLCFLMAVMSSFISMRGCLRLERNRLNRVLPVRVYTAIYSIMDSFISLPSWSSTQIPVIFGTGFCLLGLLAVGKKCVHIVDAIHILNWLALLVMTVVSPSQYQNTHAATVSLILCLVTTCMCFKCLTLPRQSWWFSQIAPQTFNQVTPNRKQKTSLKEDKLTDESKEALSVSESVSFGPSLSPLPKSPITPSSPLCQSSPSSSPLLYPVGEPRNFFKPITPSSTGASSQSSFSSTSPIDFSCPDKSKSTFEVVRDGLESFSLGLTRKSGSKSSIWSLPFALSENPSSPDSTLPTHNTNTAVTTTSPTTPANNTDVSQSESRNILSPSRLSFLSFSHSPSPGKFSSSSPHSDPDSGCGLDSPQHTQYLSFNTSIHNNKDDESNGKEITPSPDHKKHSFTKYRNESKTLSGQPHKLDNQPLSSLKERKKIVSPDSTSNENIGPRRSNRIAMRGKIIKPWPLKKSLSVNNMYDRPQEVDFLKKGNDDVDKGGVRIRADSQHLSLFTRKSAYLGSGRDNQTTLDRIPEFSDDEDFDASWGKQRKNRRVMRGETDKESRWTWTLLGVVIGVSVTVNFFLGLIMWTNSSVGKSS